MKQLKNSLTMLGILAVIVIAVVTVRRFNAPSGRGGSADAVFGQFTPAEATALTVKGKRAPVVLQRSGNDWIVASADSFPADTAHLGRAFGIIAGMDASTLVSANPAKQGVFQVDSASGVRVTVQAGDKTVADVILGKNGPGYNSTYFRAAGSDNVYLYTEKSIKYEFGEDAARWKDTFIMKFAKDALASFTLEYPDAKIEIGKGADLAWRLLQPEDVPAKQNEVNTVVNALASLGSKDMERTGSALMAYGFDRPQCTVTAVLGDGSVRRVTVGAEVPDRDEKLYYAQRDDRPGFVYTLRKYQFDNITKRFEELKDDTPPPGPDSAAAVQ